MKFIKRTFLTIIILTVVGILLRGSLYRKLVTYKSIGQRTNYIATNHKLIDYLNQIADKETNQNINQLIELSLSATSKQLNFTTDKNNNDPNKLITTRIAHCVGYASFFATTCNYFLKKYNLIDTWTTKTQIGQLYFLGTNIHQYFDTPFFKDHDFVTIENKKTGEFFAVDPTINDYFFINYVTFK